MKNLITFIALTSLMGCTHIKPQTPLKCELPGIINSRDSFTQATCAVWPYGWEHETALIHFFKGDKLLVSAEITGNIFNVNIPLSIFERGATFGATHATVIHNHLRRVVMNPNDLSEKDLKSMGVINAQCLRVGITLEDFVVLSPNGHILSAKHAGYLR